MIFTAEDLAFLRRPHVARAWFAELDLPVGIRRMHTGVGRVELGGHEWRGVTDPVNGQLVGIDVIEDPRFGQAPSIQIVLAGVGLEFFKSVRQDAREIEGRRCDFYWAAFDQETAQIWPRGLVKLFPGKMSAPTRQWQGIGVRTIAVTIESLWQSQNYPFTPYRWNDAGLRARHPGAKGFMFVGVRVQETLR